MLTFRLSPLTMLFLLCLCLTLSALPVSHAAADQSMINELRAAEGFALSAGALKIGLTTTLMQDDNIFNNVRKEVTDRVIVLTPGIRFDTAGKGFSIAWAPDFNFYGEHEDNNYTAHNVFAEAAHEAGAWRLRATDVWQQAKTPNDDAAEQDRRGYERNTLSATALYAQPSRVHTALLMLQRQDVRYDDKVDKPSNSSTTVAALTGVRTMGPQGMQGLVQLQVDAQEFPDASSANSRDAVSQRLELGIRYRRGKETYLSVQGGVQSISFDNAAFSKTDETGSSVSATLRQQLGEKVTLQAQALRRMMVSTYAGSGLWNVSPSTWFTYTRLALTLSADVSDALSLSATAGRTDMQHNRTNTVRKEREDTVDTLSAQIDYELRKGLKAGVFLTHLSSDSNDHEVDRLRNRVGITLTAVR